MRNFIVFLICLPTIFLFGQHSVPLRTLSYNQLKASSANAINNHTFNQMISDSDRFKLLYMFYPSCKHCVYMFDELFSIANENKNKVDLYVVIPKLEEKALDEAIAFFLNEKKFTYPIFYVSDPKEKNNAKRSKFVRQLIPGYPKYHYRIPIILLFNNRNQLIYAANEVGRNTPNDVITMGKIIRKLFKNAQSK